jgi:hypothetical protein
VKSGSRSWSRAPPPHTHTHTHIHNCFRILTYFIPKLLHSFTEYEGSTLHQDLLNFCQTTRRYIPADCNVHLRYGSPNRLCPSSKITPRASYKLSENWLNCAVLTDNSAGLRTVFLVVFHTENCAVHSGNPTVSSVYLPTSQWHHPFLATHSAIEHRMIYSFSNTTSSRQWGKG